MSHETQKVTMSMDKFIRADPTYSLVAVCDGKKTQIFSFSDGKQEYKKDLPPPEGTTAQSKDLAFLPVSKEDAKYLEDGENMSGRMLLAAYGTELFLYEEVEPFDFQCRGKVQNVDEFGSCLVVSTFPRNLLFGLLTPGGVCCVYSLSVGQKGDAQALPIRRYTAAADENELDDGEETKEVTRKILWMDFLDNETILCASENAVYECKLAHRKGNMATEAKMGDSKWTKICLSRHGTGQLAILFQNGKLRVYLCSRPKAGEARTYRLMECEEELNDVDDMTWSPFGYCLAVQKTDGEVMKLSPVPKRGDVTPVVFRKQEED